MSADYTPPEISNLMGFVDTYLRWKFEQGRGNRRYLRYHPSEWGKCLRKQQYLHYIELGFIKIDQPPIGSQLIRLFDKGHNMHTRWQQDYFNGMSILRGRWKCTNICCRFWDSNGKFKPDEDNVGKPRIYGEDDLIGSFKPDVCACGNKKFKYMETPVESKELNFAGRADAVLDFSKFDVKRFEGVRCNFNIKTLPIKPIVIDMKTISDYQWKGKLLKTGPHIEYIIQLIIYIHLLDCEYGIILYENKNTSSTLYCKVDRNEEMFETIKWQSKMMQQMDDRKLLPPPRPSQKNDKDCKKCEFSHICHGSLIWTDDDLEEKRKKFYRNIL